MRVYLASPFFTPEQLSVVEKLEALIMSFDRLVLYSPRADGVLTTMTQSARNMAASIIFDTNVKEIEACDFMLAVIDGRDIGVIWEMGFAYAKKKPNHHIY
jgi:nucleoside 2-deoxyribosyltransferase